MSMCQNVHKGYIPSFCFGQTGRFSSLVAGCICILSSQLSSVELRGPGISGEENGDVPSEGFPAMRIPQAQWMVSVRENPNLRWMITGATFQEMLYIVARC